MKLFGFQKKIKKNAHIKLEGIDIEFDIQNEWWSFSFQGIHCISYGFELKMPSVDLLTNAISGVLHFEKEMKSRIKKGLTERGCKDFDPEYTVDVEVLSEKNMVLVLWSDGENRSDIGIDFEVKDNKIMSEDWSD